ncbi:hypothetical protein Tco_1069140 [Tanacetum coccineum]|uniref:Uncharacterized protein n=1 Tax=Tanacetum coccineum TaxID=301880 RepID=A0ABQ5HHN8_9ASTR
MQVTLHYEAIVMQVMLHNKRIVMQVMLHYEAIVMQVTLHDKRIVMQVTLHYKAIVMQVTLHDKRIVMQVTLHYEAIVMQVTLHDKRIVMQVMLHYEAIVMKVTLLDKRIVMQVVIPYVQNLFEYIDAHMKGEQFWMVNPHGLEDLHKDGVECGGLDSLGLGGAGRHQGEGIDSTFVCGGAVMLADYAVTYTSVHSKARSWSIPSEDPYEEAAQQFLE